MGSELYDVFRNIAFAWMFIYGGAVVIEDTFPKTIPTLGKLSPKFALGCTIVAALLFIIEEFAEALGWTD